MVTFDSSPTQVLFLGGLVAVFAGMASAPGLAGFLIWCMAAVTLRAAGGGY